MSSQLSVQWDVCELCRPGREADTSVSTSMPSSRTSQSGPDVVFSVMSKVTHKYAKYRRWNSAKFRENACISIFSHSLQQIHEHAFPEELQPRRQTLLMYLYLTTNRVQRGPLFDKNTKIYTLSFPTEKRKSGAALR